MRSRNLLVTIIALLVCLPAIADSRADSLVRQYNMHWSEIKCDFDEPTPDRPSFWQGANKPGFYSGALMGNGLLGANFYKLKPDVYRLNFSRSDVTEQRPWFGLYEQARLPIGYFTLATAGKVQEESMDLSIYDAETSGTFTTDCGKISFKTYVHANKECLVFESTTTGGEKNFVWDFVPFKAISPCTYRRQGPAGYQNAKGDSNPEPYRIDKKGEHFLVQPLARDTTFTKIEKYYVVAWKEVSKSSKRNVYATITFRESLDDALAEARDIIRSAAKTSSKKMRASHQSWWHQFYDSAAYLTFPDKAVERFHWMQYYKFASTARPGKPIVDLQGVWPIFDTPWPAVWVNLNLELTYCWQTKANLGSLAQPLWDSLWENQDNLRRNVTDVAGQEGWTDSACLPRASSYDFHCPLRPSLAATNAYEVGNLAWLLHYWYLQCLAYGDDAQMRDRLFPLLKAATNIFFHIRIAGEDGKYSLPPTSSPEYGEGTFCVGPNSNYDLANLRQALMTLIAIDDRFSINDPQRKDWEEFLAGMPDFQYDENTGFKISEQQEFLETTHRHYSHLFMIYPYHMLDWNDATERAKAEFSISRWHGNTGYSHTGKAAMLASEGKGDEAIAELEDFIKEWVKPNTLYAESGPVIETPFAAVSSLHEFYLQDWGDRLRVFYGCPSSWTDVEFSGMRAVGAFLVSAKRTAGKTATIDVTSERGEVCRIQSDLKFPSIVDEKGNHVQFEFLPCPELGGEGTLVQFKTVAGGRYHIEESTIYPALWRMSEIEQIRGDKEFLMMADRYCTIKPATVMDKPYSITGDFHTYESIASYVWPDPDHPGKYITRDGIFNPDCDKFDRTAIFSYTRNLMVLSKAYYLTGDEKYKEAWTRHVNAFHFDEATFMRPNFDHGQMIVGTREGNLGEPGGIIDAFHFVNVTESIRLMTALGAVDEELSANLKSWFGQFCDWLTDSYLGKKEGTAKNNHATAYDVLVCALAQFCDKQDVFDRVSGEFVTKRLDTQIMPDGTQPFELCRTKPMRYSMFNLLHVIEYCWLLENAGTNFYLEHKERLDAAFAYILSYLGRHSEFPYPNINNEESDEAFVRSITSRLEGLKGTEGTYDFDSFRLPSHVHSEYPLQNLLNWEYEMFDYDDALTPPNRNAAKQAIADYWNSRMKESFDSVEQKILEVAETQISDLVEASASGDALRLPSSFADGKVKFVPVDDWVSGFFPGTLWYMYELTGQESWANDAVRFTEVLDTVQYLTWHHDIGFMINDSYGNGLRLKSIEKYKDVVVNAAKSLSTRFRPGAGIIQSWNADRGWQKERGWKCPVIIDNMMNLELLFNATQITGDSTFFNIAVSHADKTIANHFRDDFSCYHVVDYDPETGEVRRKCTAQGYADESAWARGQAWALYGFAAAYRHTGYERYLTQAKNIASFLLSHKNLPEDQVPYWDFDVTDTYRDVSSATIIASALYDLAALTGEDDYRASADHIVYSLSTPAYMAEPGTNGGFLLKHSVGSVPHNSSVDVPLNYADYYLLESLLRRRKL